MGGLVHNFFCFLGGGYFLSPASYWMSFEGKIVQNDLQWRIFLFVAHKQMCWIFVCIVCAVYIRAYHESAIHYNRNSEEFLKSAAQWVLPTALREDIVISGKSSSSQYTKVQLEHWYAVRAVNVVQCSARKPRSNINLKLPATAVVACTHSQRKGVEQAS